MFTGIIEDIGLVHATVKSGSIYRLTVESASIAKTSKIGDSIALNGVCLTLVEKPNGIMSFDVMEETVRRTNLINLKKGDRVNLEDALRPDEPLGGHFVLGHIDCTGKIASIENSGGEFVIEIKFPPSFDNLIVEKGSIAVDGVSLTVGEAGSGSFKVYVIPHTLKITSLGSKKPSDTVNIEFDILGKYAVRHADSKKTFAISEDFLKEKGF